MSENEAGDTTKHMRMDRLVNRARAAMNLLLLASAIVLWGNWDTGQTRFASFHYGQLLALLGENADFIPEEDFRELFLPDARKAGNQALDAAKAVYEQARNAGDTGKASQLSDARSQLHRSLNKMAESREQQLTVSAFESKPLEILGFHVHPSRAGGLLSLTATGLLLYLICLARTMRRYPCDGSDWIFHLDGRLPVILGGCWLLLPAAAVTMATWQLLWEILVSGIIQIDSFMLLLLVQLVVGILAPLLLGCLATWFAWKTRRNPAVDA